MIFMNNFVKKMVTKTGILILLALVLFLQGAVPFLATPTVGQAIWTTGFSQSFLNDSIFSVYARNFGFPEPAAIAFGLAGAWPTTLFMKLGLHPADAYSAMAALWLSIAFFAAYRIGRFFEVPPLLSILGAVLWLSMPVIWRHAGYSMVSIGMGLLSFYFLSALNLFLNKVDSYSEKIIIVSLYIFSCVVSIFMDGYSFMMFAVGSSLLMLYIFIRFKESRRYLLQFALPVHILAFGLAYALYAFYIGRFQYDPASLDFFRGWGLDLTFLVLPTQGIHWLWDTVGWSIPRSNQKFFGDSSVWVTTFSFPIIVAGVVAWWVTRKQAKLASGFFLIALFGFYMAMGPSLKVNSIKPKLMSPLMPAELAIAPTGNAWLSENVPGFKNMRAAYRWSALGIFGSWALFIMLLARAERRGKILCAVALGVMIVSNFPHPLAKWIHYKNNRNMFFNIDSDLVSVMAGDLQKNELVAFLPYGNDFLVNYLASRLDIRTYNIGGDKNLIEARKHWPPIMQSLQMNQIDTGFIKRVLHLLASHKADAVVLPYIDMLWAAHQWPAPLVNKEKLAPAIASLKASGSVSINERKYYTVVRAKTRFVEDTAQSLPIISYPIMLAQHPANLEDVLVSGWYAPESSHVWSGPNAGLNLPVPADCIQGECSVVLTFWVYGASQNRPVNITFRTNPAGVSSLSMLTVNNSSKQQFTIPIAAGHPIQALSIDVPEAISPKDLQGNADSRVLGIALLSIELVRSRTGVDGQVPKDNSAAQNQGFISEQETKNNK